MVSIIIPVYNTEKYLCSCLDSVLAQSYTDYELLVVNDGSTDASGSIIDAYARKDSRVIAIHKDNGGVSLARNLALKRAVGEYIVFVDSDDMLPLDAIGKLVQAIKENSADLAVGSSRDVFPYKKVDTQLQCKTVSREDIPRFMMNHRYAMEGPCAKIYKRSVIKEYHLEYKQSMPYGEDTSFVLQYISKCQALCVISDNVYIRRINYNGASWSGKFYPDMVLYLKQNLIDTINLITSCAVAQEKTKLSEQAIQYYYERALTYYLRQAPTEEAVSQIERTAEEFAQYRKANIQLELGRILNKNEMSSSEIRDYIKRWRRKNILMFSKLRLKQILVGIVFKQH